MKKAMKDIAKDDVLFKEIETDLKNEQMKSLWDQYGLFIIIAVALALTAAVSFETFKAWSNKRNQELSNAYAVAVSLQNQGRFAESLGILDSLAKSSHEVYADAAKLQIANIYLEQNKKSEALDILRSLAEERGANRQMKDIAAIKLASYLLDSDTPSSEISALLEPMAKEGGSWSNIAHELLAMLAIRDGNMEKAEAEYTKIINSANAADGLKARARDMVTIIGDQQK